MITQYWIAALLIATLAAPALLPDGIQTAQADRLADETARFATEAGRPPSPTAKDANGWTDLHYAAAVNLPSVAKRLLESGAKVDAGLKSDSEPFTDELKATLHQFGEDYAGWWRAGQTPLHFAAKENAHETAAQLIENGAAVNAKLNNGWTPLHFAAGNNARETAALLIENGAAVNAKLHDGGTPLHTAAGNNARETAALLIENGAAVNAKENNGLTPLHGAAWENAHETAALLIENGAAMNAKNNFGGGTPLHIAAQENARETVALLLENGAAVNAKNNYEQTPLASALLFGADETAALLRQHGGTE